MEQIIMTGKDMIDFQKSQGDTIYFDKNYNPVDINPNYKYLVGLDKEEKIQLYIKS